MKKSSLVLGIGITVTSLLLGGTAEAKRLICKNPGYHPVSASLCCPEGAVLNKRGLCAYPTKNGCPAGYHPERHNRCCVDGSILTRDGYCTSIGYGSGSSDDSSGGGRSTHPCFTTVTGTEASDAITQCASGVGGQVVGQQFNGSFWIVTCQYGCQD